MLAGVQAGGGQVGRQKGRQEGKQEGRYVRRQAGRQTGFGQGENLPGTVYNLNRYSTVQGNVLKHFIAAHQLLFHFR